MKKFIKIMLILIINIMFVIPCYAEENTNIIYINGINGNDSNTGLTPENSIKTLKKAYELLQSLGGSIYVTNTINIDSYINITNTQYKDNDTTITLNADKKIKHIKRYSQPTNYSTLTGYDTASNKNILMNISSTGELLIENLTIDGHSDKVENISNELNANGLSETKNLFHNSGILTINNSTLQNNNANVYGGAIYNLKTLNINNSTIKNHNGEFGGALYDKGTTNITNSIFSNNNATRSGGAILSENSAILNNTNFYSNSALAGGAIYVQGTVKIYDSELSNNHSEGSGGSIFISTNHTLEIKNCLVHDNNAKKFGAGIYANGSFIAENTDFYNNTAVDGGAMTAGSDGSSFSLNSCKIYNNTVTGIGGGVEGYGTFEIINSEIYNNKSKDGGGIWNKGIAKLQGTTIKDNVATGNGNGIYQNNTLNINENVILENNDIYLTKDKKVNVVAQIPEDAQYIITPNDYNLGQVIVTIDDTLSENASDILKNFKLTPKEKYIERPGDLNTDTSISDKDIIISKINATIKYDDSSSEDESTLEPINIYWQEEIEISDIIPTRDGYEFKGWNTTEQENLMTKEELEEFLNNLTEDTTIIANYEKLKVPNTLDNISNIIVLFITMLLGLISVIKLFLMTNKKAN